MTDTKNDTLTTVKNDVDAVVDAAISLDPEPISKLLLSGGKAAFDLIMQIANKHGQEGIDAAIATLAAVRDTQGYPVTDAQEALDDASVDATIASWYAKAKP